jgi:hypothetical protein
MRGSSLPSGLCGGAFGFFPPETFAPHSRGNHRCRAAFIWRSLVIAFTEIQERRTKGSVRMNDVIGISWYKDEHTYRRALAIFTDPKNMPATYEDWQAIVRRECEEIKGAGNIALRVDIDPETLKAWCNAHGFLPDAQGRMAFVNHVELEYQKTGKGTVIE